MESLAIEKAWLKKLPQATKRPSVLFIINHHLPGVFIYRLTGSVSETEERVQDVLLKLLMTRESLAVVNDVRVYFCIATHNRALNAVERRMREIARQQKWQKEKPLNVINEEADLPHSLLDNAIAQLPPQQKRVTCKAIVFAYLVNNRQKITATPRPVLLNGLDPLKQYTVKEINLYPGTNSTLAKGQTYSGDYRIKTGINPNITLARTSVLLETNEVR